MGLASADAAVLALDARCGEVDAGSTTLGLLADHSQFDCRRDWVTLVRSPMEPGMHYSSSWCRSSPAVELGIGANADDARPERRWRSDAAIQTPSLRESSDGLLTVGHKSNCAERRARKCSTVSAASLPGVITGWGIECLPHGCGSARVRAFAPLQPRRPRHELRSRADARVRLCRRGLPQPSESLCDAVRIRRHSQRGCPGGAQKCPSGSAADRRVPQPKPGTAWQS